MDILNFKNFKISDSKPISFDLKEQDKVVLHTKNSALIEGILETALGFNHNFSGEVYQSGTNLKLLTKQKIYDFRSTVGFISFRKLRLRSNFTLYENLSINCEYFKFYTQKDLENIVVSLAEKYNLKEYLDKLPTQIPDDVKRIAYIARAIIKKPKILFIDIPENNFNENETAIISEHIKTKENSCLIGTTNINFTNIYKEQTKIVEI